MTDFSNWVNEQKARVGLALNEAISPSEERLAVAMRYSVLSAGKRIRALLVYASAHTVGGALDTYTPAATAVELIHAYSLVHDDLPCMDNDDLRRGQASCHIAFDEATALLVGDALQSLAFEMIALPNARLDASQQLLMLQILARAASEMVRGQALDMANVGRTLDEIAVHEMHQKKTGALIEAAVRLGSISSCEQTQNILAEYARTIGLAYQIADDILDTNVSADAIGKTTGKDARFAKPTFVTMLGLSNAKQKTAQLRARALALLDDLPFDNRIFYDLTHFILPSACC